MDQIPIEILDKVKLFLALLEKNKIPIRKAILFGSYANGTYNEWSDIDIALVSDSFLGNRFLDKETLRKFKSQIDYSISPLPFKTEDFDISNLFVKEIVETGITVK
jgi:predicted nucleotidyltransferase